jgi:hypothetical protein
MLRGLEGAALGSCHETTDRGAIHDCAATLFEHLPQLGPHAAPDAPKIDGNRAVKVLSGAGRGLRSDILDAGVVVGCIEPTEFSDGPPDHFLNLIVVRDVTADSERLVAQ